MLARLRSAAMPFCRISFDIRFVELCVRIGMWHVLTLSLGIWREGSTRPSVLPWLFLYRCQKLVFFGWLEFLELCLLNEELTG